MANAKAISNIPLLNVLPQFEIARICPARSGRVWFGEVIRARCMPDLQGQFADDVMDVPGGIESDVRERKTIVSIVEAAVIGDAIGWPIEVPLVKSFRVPAERKGRLRLGAFGGVLGVGDFRIAGEQGDYDECERNGEYGPR